MDSSTGKVLTPMLMARNMLVSTRMASRTGKVLSLYLAAKNMLASSRMDSSTGRAPHILQTAQSAVRAYGLMANFCVQHQYNKRQYQFVRVVMHLGGVIALVLTPLLMALNTLVSGRTANRTGKVPTAMSVALNMLVSGRMASGTGKGT